MMKTRTAALASAVALSAAAVTAAPAYAAPAPAAQTGVVQYADTAPGAGAGSAGGSLENEIVQVGLILVAGIGVSIAMAVGAGIAGGAIELPQIPGLPF